MDDIKLILLVTCSTFCQKLFYAQGFEIEGDKESCFCADRVKKSTPVALPITLKWTHAPNHDEPEVDPE